MSDENRREPENMSADELAAEIVCDGAPCPVCCGACEVLTADLWQCEKCGAVVSARQIMEGPHNYER
jgi:tRNA(Ile2) C34 agmatinyltransferase TiaS